MKLSHTKITAFIAIIIFIAALIFTALYIKSVADYKRAVRETSFVAVELSLVPDGVYTGEYDVNFISAKVEVTVQSEMITGIDLIEHNNERGTSAEAVIDQIYAQQKIDVDVSILIVPLPYTGIAAFPHMARNWESQQIPVFYIPRRILPTVPPFPISFFYIPTPRPTL